MMNFIKNNPIIAFVGIGAVLILAAAIIFLSQIRTNQPTADQAGQDTTAITSQFTGSTEDISVNYGGDIDPFKDGVMPNLVVFGEQKLPVPDITRRSLRAALVKALAPEIHATSSVTYIQVDKSTLNCTDKYDCSFKFYLDSPEGYYDFRLFRNSTGGIEYTIVKQPLPGVAK